MALSAVVAIVPLNKVVELNRILATKDTREQFYDWAAINIPFRGVIGDLRFWRFPRPDYLPNQMTFNIGRAVFDAPCGTPQLPDTRWLLVNRYHAANAFWVTIFDEDTKALLSSRAVEVAKFTPLVREDDAPFYEFNDAFYVPLDHLEKAARPGPELTVYRIECRSKDT